MATPTDDTYSAASGEVIYAGQHAPDMAPPTGKYRFQQPLLFHRAHQKIVEASYVNSLGQTIRVPSMDYTFGNDNIHAAMPSTNCGSDYRDLCLLSNWSWANYGGDWLDNSTPDRIKQGSVAWATSSAIPLGSPAGEVSIDVSNLVGHCDQAGRWYAFFIKVSGGELQLVGPCAPGQKSALEIVRGGVAETRGLWYACTLITTATVNAMDAVVVVSNGGRGVIEFYRPTDQSVAASSAVLKLRHNGVASGNPVVSLFLVDPSVPDMAAPAAGLAASYPLDAGILANANVAGALRVVDGMSFDDVIDAGYVNIGAQSWYGGSTAVLKQESRFDPTLWGTPGTLPLAGVAAPTQPELDAMMPNRAIVNGVTKLFGTAARSTTYGDTLRVLTSAEIAGRGLPLLAPGMGAVEMIYPSTRLLPGQTHGQSQTGGGPLADGLNYPDLEMVFKREHIGRVVDGYMRMHVCLAEGWETDDSMFAIHPFGAPENYGKWPEEYGADPLALQWRATDFAGKFPGGIQQITTGVRAERYVYPTRMNGVTPDSSKVVENPGNGYGSTSGVYGYQGRFQFKQGFYKQGFEGPACGGAVLGVELYDFAQNSFCIPSQTFVAEWTSQTQAGFKYGLGHLQPRKWYCVEMRWKMNTVVPPYAEAAVGTHFLESGFVQDGFIEWWVDGVYASKSPLFAHRNGRPIDWPLQIAQSQPFGTSNAFRPVNNVPAEAYMGATAAILQCYYGGRSALMKNLHVLINGVVASSGAYIGPMKGVGRDNGGIP